MTCEIHQDDIGTRILITIEDCDEVLDISDALTKIFIFRKPDNSLIYRTAEFPSGMAVSGQLYYNTVAGDFDQNGTWKIQAKLSFASGTYYTNVESFRVERNL